MGNRLATLSDTVGTLPTVTESVAALLLSTVRREAARLTPAALSGADRDDVVSVATVYALAGLSDSVTPSADALRVAARRALSVTLRRAVEDMTDGRAVPVGTLSTDDDDETPAPVRIALASAATPDGARIAETTDSDRLGDALTLARAETPAPVMAAITTAARTLSTETARTGRPSTLAAETARTLGGRKGTTLATVRDALATLSEAGTATLFRHSVRSTVPGHWDAAADALAAAAVDRTPVPVAPGYGAGPVVTLHRTGHAPVPYAAPIGPAAVTVTVDGRTVATFGPDAYAATVAAFAAPAFARSAYVPTASDRDADGFAARQESPGPVRKPSSRKRSGSGSTGPTVPARLSR